MFQRAQRKKVKLRLGISGISNSGKTWSSLEIASGMFPQGKIALIDTENGRGELYADDFNYDCLPISAPYTPQKYIDAIKAAENEGYNILIIDSLSHAWVGDGGILSIAESAGKNTFTDGWRKATPLHNALINAILSSPLHIIITMRAKSDYVVETNEKGKSVPRKVGMAPVQREGLDYEMMLYMEMREDNTAHITKDNTRLFGNNYIKPSRDMGVQLLDWLNSGIDIKQEFVEKIIPQVIQSIESCNDLQSLRNCYAEAYTKYYPKFPEQFRQILDAKDKRKIRLENINDLSNDFGFGDVA